jgi:hypothetical protein
MQTSSFRSSAILAAALLALSATAHAQSNVTIYGAIGVDMVSANHVYNGSTSHTEHAIEDNAIVNSRFGLKGTKTWKAASRRSSAWSPRSIRTPAPRTVAPSGTVAPLSASRARAMAR